jgi:hypothetical protein
MSTDSAEIERDSVYAAQFGQCPCAMPSDIVPQPSGIAVYSKHRCVRSIRNIRNYFHRIANLNGLGGG